MGLLSGAANLYMSPERTLCIPASLRCMSAADRCPPDHQHPSLPPLLLFLACSYDGAGAVWDICPRGKASKQLAAFLAAHTTDFTHQGSMVSSSTLPIVALNTVLSQAFMLAERHRQQLQEEQGVQLWHFEQHPGEAVFIPGGCPHQVRNLSSCCKVGD